MPCRLGSDFFRSGRVSPRFLSDRLLETVLSDVVDLGAEYFDEYIFSLFEWLFIDTYLHT
jgi:hypothetical protein